MTALTLTWDWDIVDEALPEMLGAFVKVTLLVTVVASILAALLGLVWAIALRELPRPVGAALSWALGVVRMTPLPLQLLIAVWGVASPAGWLSHISFSAHNTRLMIIGIVVFSIHYSTYMAESYRAGIESIREGQWEAATALSLPRGRVWRAVIIPQALRATLPSLGNWAIAMFKDTPYLIAITVPEMVTKAKEIGGGHFKYVEVFTLAGLIFLVASYPTAILMRRMEKKLEY